MQFSLSLKSVVHEITKYLDDLPKRHHQHTTNTPSTKIQHTIVDVATYDHYTCNICVIFRNII